MNKAICKTKPDFARVEDHQRDIHARLRNWSRWVAVHPQMGRTHPMFAQYRSHAWQWHEPEYREPCDLIDAMMLEGLVAQLPPTHREAVRWAYVWRYSPAIMCRKYRLSYDGLYRHLRDGRQMLLGMVESEQIRGEAWQ